MPSGLGLLIMPVSILLLIRKDNGPVAKFARAGATSPESARRPASLDVQRMFLVQDAVKSGVMVATGDGRFYVDMPIYRRRRRRAAAIATLGATAIFALGLWLWSPWAA
jgi:hypothetical protein